MPRYKPGELGEVQKKILTHFFSCEIEKPETVSHISQQIGILQPSVYRSVDLLIKAGYLLKRGKSSTAKKEILLTPKGTAATVLLGITVDQLVQYFKGVEKYDVSGADAARYFEGFALLPGITDPKRRNIMLREMMEYLLKTNYFSEAGLVTRRLSDEEQKRLMMYVAIKYYRAAGEPRTIMELIDKYGLDKSFLKKMLEKEKASIDSLVRELGP